MRRSTDSHPGAIARTKAPNVVTQRRPDAATNAIPSTVGTATTNATTRSGRTAVSTASLVTMAAI